MKFTKPLLILFLLSLSSSILFGENNIDINHDPLLKTFITNIKRLPDASYQEQLNKQAYWQNFLQKNGQWLVSFNEENQIPHYAVGTPIQMNAAATPQSVANDFIASQLAEFYIPMNDLKYRNTATNSKYHYVHFTQQYKGLEVLWAHALIKMTLDNRIMQFGLDVYDDININVAPTLSVTDVIAAASRDVSGITKTSSPVLKVLPVPTFHKNIYHLVYEIKVSNVSNENVPAEYYTLIDANTGDVLYRQNNINHISTVSVSGTVYPTHQYNPTAIEPFRNLRILSGGTNYYTDSAGFADLSISTSSSATLYLQGLWAKVQTAGIVPSFTTTLVTGANNLSFDLNANVKEMSAYQSVQEIHDYYKTVSTAFSPNLVMDFAMTTNIDVSGQCNAFYNGTSINFFDLGGGCNPSSEVGDVVYHEYGHAINGHVYNYYGGNFNNGALNEGYADTWANGLTEDPVLGIGFFSGDPNGFVRRYDVDKKVYPADLVGEVHADGEIIAGAWWDVGLNFGNFQSRQNLFFETFAATLTAPNGSEGQLYSDVLIEALTNDDNDGNLNNGTPNYCAITSAFALHGLTINASILGLNNTSALAAPSSTITLTATANSLPGGNLIAHYLLNQNTGSWINAPMTNVGGINYEVLLPSVPNGNIILYYYDAVDQCGISTVVLPTRAADTDPNISYNMLVGYSQFSINDFDNNGGVWTTGAPGDNALTGAWEIAVPQGTFVNPNDPSTVVQPDAQVTFGGALCAVTGHNAGTGVSSFDVDGGHTTLISPVFDLSGHVNPAFSYYRWYTNNMVFVFILDYWRVSISNDNGATWVPVENTRTDDHSWRRNAFRVSDYVAPTSQVLVRFVAEDALPNALVEGLVDDFVLWDEVPAGVHENENALAVNIYPNPVSDVININWNQKANSGVKIIMLDDLGREVYKYVDDKSKSIINEHHINTSDFADGIYIIELSTNSGTYTQKVSVVK